MARMGSTKEWLANFFFDKLDVACVSVAVMVVVVVLVVALVVVMPLLLEMASTNTLLTRISALSTLTRILTSNRLKTQFLPYQKISVGPSD